MNVVDERIILEAARLLIASFDLEFVRGTAIERNTFQIFFIQFLKSIQGVDAKNTDVVSTYITAIYHFLLASPLEDIQHELFADFLFTEDSPDTLSEITDLKSTLACVHMRQSGNSLYGDGYLDVGDIFRVAREDPFRTGYNMPFVLLALSVLDTKELSMEDLRLRVEFIHGCARNIPLRRATKLIYWILSGNGDPNEPGSVKSRWDAYSP